MDAGYFKGTSADQDNRFVDKNKKLMKTMKFGEDLGKKVDMTRVDMDIIRPWVNKTITDYLHDEDDVLVEFICNQLDAPSPDGRQMQVNVTGFLGPKNGREFMQKLWQLLLSAMDDICGIPAELKDQKKEQIRMKQEEQGRVNENLRMQQSIIQEAIAKIKVNAAAAAAAINNRSLKQQPEQPGRRGRLTVGLSRSRSRSQSAMNRNAKASEAVNAQSKPADRSEKTAEASPGDQKKPGTEESSHPTYGQRRKPSSYGRNRIRSPSPRKERRRSRENSPYRKSSQRRHTKSPNSTRKDMSRRRSPSPHHPKVSPSHQRTYPSRHRRSLTPERHGGHSSHHRSSHDDRQRHPDVRGDPPNKRSRGRSESSESPRVVHERSRSRSPSAKNIQDGKTLEKSSVFHHRNYRTHGEGRISSPEDPSISPKPVNPRGSRNGHKKSLSPALPVKSDFPPPRRQSPRYSGRRHHAASLRRNPTPEGKRYSTFEPVCSSTRLSPHLGHTKSQRHSSSFSPGRRSQDQRWVNERRRASPTSRYGYQEMPGLVDIPPESVNRRSRIVSQGYYDNWGSSSKWDEVELRSRQRSPRALPERCTLSPLVERRRISPFPDRYVGQHEGRWPSSPRRDPRGPADDYRAHVGVPRYDRPREEFDGGQANPYNRGISNHRKRHGDSPFQRIVPYDSDVRESTGDYHADLPPARGPPGLRPPSPAMALHSHVHVRSSGPQRRDDYDPRGIARGERYPMRGSHCLEDSYDTRGDKFNPRFERHRNSYDRLGDGYEPYEDRFDPRHGGQVGDVHRMRVSQGKGDYSLQRSNYNSQRADRIIVSHVDRGDDLQRYHNQRSRSRSPHRSRSPNISRSPRFSRSQNRSRSPRWTNREAWIEENAEASGLRTSKRGHRSSGHVTDRERTEPEGFEYKPKYRDVQQRETSRSLKRARSSASSSPDGASRSSNHERSLSGSVDRRGASVDQYSYHGNVEGFEEKTNERRATRSVSPSSPPPTKKLRIEDENAEASEAEVSSKKKKKKKKEKKKRRKKHKKHKKHKTKRSQEDENESNTDHETQDDEVTSHTPESRSNALEVDQELELREKAILSLKTSK